MIEIGPNLMAVLLALVAVLASLASAVATYWSLQAHARAATTMQQNSSRISAVEKVLNGSMKEKV